ncbi:MAG TPA: hypothetical protein VGN88_07460 [Phycisphaerae bacterium]|jgi:hypothetical protein
MSRLVLDVDSLASLLARIGVSELKSVSGALHFQIKGTYVSINKLDLGGEVTYDGLNIKVKKVDLGDEGLELDFSIV